jgi:hypothetical protein
MKVGSAFAAPGATLLALLPEVREIVGAYVRVG